MEPMYIEEGPQQTYVKKGLLGRLGTPAIAGIVGVIAVVVVLGVVLGLIPVYINSSSSSSSSSSSYSSTSLSTSSSSCTTSSCSSSSLSSGRTIVARGITATSTNTLTYGNSNSASADQLMQSYWMTDANMIALGLSTVTTYWTITTSGSTTQFTQYTTLTFTAVLTSSNQNTGPTGTSPTNIVGEFLGTNSGSSKFSSSSLTVGALTCVIPTSASTITTSYTYGYISGGAITGNTCTGTGNSPTSSCSTVNNQPSGSITVTPAPPTALINVTVATSANGRFGPGANAPKLVDSDFVLFELN